MPAGLRFKLDYLAALTFVSCESPAEMERIFLYQKQGDLNRPYSTEENRCFNMK